MRILLLAGEIKQQIRLDERPRRFVAEDDLAVAVAVHVLDFEIRVELVRDAQRVFAVLGEDVVECGVVRVGP